MLCERNNIIAVKYLNNMTTSILAFHSILHLRSTKTDFGSSTYLSKGLWVDYLKDIGQGLRMRTRAVNKFQRMIFVELNMWRVVGLVSLLQ